MESRGATVIVNNVTADRPGPVLPLRFLPEREERTQPMRFMPLLALARFTAIYSQGFA
jgi:hypothetical protein